MRSEEEVSFLFNLFLLTQKRSFWAPKHQQLGVSFLCFWWCTSCAHISNTLCCVWDCAKKEVWVTRNASLHRFFFFVLFFWAWVLTPDNCEPCLGIYLFFPFPPPFPFVLFFWAWVSHPTMWAFSWGLSFFLFFVLFCGGSFSFTTLSCLEFAQLSDKHA